MKYQMGCRAVESGVVLLCWGHNNENKQHTNESVPHKACVAHFSVFPFLSLREACFHFSPGHRKRHRSIIGNSY